MKNFRSGILVLSVVFVAGISLFLLAGCGEKKPGTETKVSTGAAKKPVETLEAPVPSTAPITEERTFYGFETGLQGWEIPMWAKDKSDYVAEEVMISTDAASQGASSMKAVIDFPGDLWTAGLIEIEQYLER